MICALFWGVSDLMGRQCIPFLRQQPNSPSPSLRGNKRGCQRSETQGGTRTDKNPPQPSKTPLYSPLNIKGEGWDHRPSFQSLTSEFKYARNDRGAYAPHPSRGRACVCYWNSRVLLRRIIERA